MNNTYPFTLSPLPYANNALEPYIGTETMIIHHSKYLQNYINKLNDTLEDQDAYHDWTLEELLTNNDNLPASIRSNVRNYAGGVYNHNLYFEQFKPYTPPKYTEDNIPDHLFCDFLNETFISFENFQSLFKWYALSVFGSGYAWLVLNNDHSMKFMSTANQDTPLPLNLQPILTIDVWEHAYFLDYKNERETYIEQFFNVIDWDKIEDRYAKLVE